MSASSQLIFSAMSWRPLSVGVWLVAPHSCGREAAAEQLVKLRAIARVYGSSKRMEASVQQQFYRPKEACEVLRIGMATLYRRIKAGDIRASKLGGATLISHAEVLRVTQPGFAS